MAAWANLSGLTIFTIHNNSVTGTLPNELAAAWPRLEHLDLGWNRLAGEGPARMHRAARVGGGLSMFRLAGRVAADTRGMRRHHPKGLVDTAAAVP